jgi:hypothetical protein
MARRATPDLKPKAARKKSRLARVLLWLLGGGVLLIALVWYAVHHFDWAGPLIANSLRAVFGDDTVAKLEDAVYGVEDRVNRVLKRDEPPKAYWNVPTAQVAPSAAPVASAQVAPAVDASIAFSLVNPGPALKDWSAPGDGEWVGVRDARHPEEPPRMFKTLLHPDKGRSWAEVFVVAIDLNQVELFPVAGTQEPQPDSEEAKKYLREGKIPVASQATLLAAFNGGFMTAATA